jgi:hypothetical protein
MKALKNQAGMGARAAHKKAASQKALMGYKKKNFVWRGATVEPNRKIFCQDGIAVELNRK